MATPTASTPLRSPSRDAEFTPVHAPGVAAATSSSHHHHTTTVSSARHIAPHPHGVTPASYSGHAASAAPHPVAGADAGVAAASTSSLGSSQGFSPAGAVQVVSVASQPAVAMSIDQLMAAMERENEELERQARVKDDAVAKLRARAAATQRAAEIEEDRIMRRLQKRCDSAAKSVVDVHKKIHLIEKQNADAVHRIDELKREKARIENSIECEQEGLVNRLQRQLLTATQDRSLLLRRLHDERLAFVGVLEAEVTRLKSLNNGGDFSNPDDAAASPQAVSTRSSGSSNSAAASPTSQQVHPAVTATIAAARERQNGATATTGGNIATEEQIVLLEEKIAQLLYEAGRVTEERQAMEQQIAAMCDSIKRLQNETVVEKSREAKWREELEKVRTELQAEKQSEERFKELSQRGPIDSAVAVGSGVFSRPGHQRTVSGSSNESYSSSSSSLSCVNLSLAASRDPRLVREHTARLLMTPTIATAASADRSQRSGGPGVEDSGLGSGRSDINYSSNAPASRGASAARGTVTPHTGRRPVGETDFPTPPHVSTTTQK